MFKKLFKFVIFLLLLLIFILLGAKWLDRRPPMDMKCIESVRSHDYCNTVGGAIDACKSIIKQECFPHP